jgi:lipid-binding SYLF domain-containing protein
LISGWRPAGNSDQVRKAGFKTIEALKKFKKVRRLKPYFREAKGYAVFPSVGKAGFGIGGARGKGEVFEDNKVIGSTTLTQLSFGIQLGGQAFSQIIFFQDEKDLNRFTEGNFEFGASASAALITEGANASADYSDGVAVMTFLKGGLMYEASIGGQKFTFKGY